MGQVLGKAPESLVVLSDDFESGSLGGQWTTYSSGTAGRIQVTDQFGGAEDSNFALLMDRTSSGTAILNEAVWTVDLPATSGTLLSFWHAEWQDEQTPLPPLFTGHVDGDGVAISDDGIQWYTVLNATDIGVSGEWQHVVIDLVAAADAAGMNLGPTLQIKFQQFDNFALPTDGRGYDQIDILTQNLEDADWYSFELDDGQSASFVLTELSIGNLTLDLFGTSRLATGVAAGNVDWVIDNFTDSSTDGVSNTYYVRVQGTEADYSLGITKDADFATEPTKTNIDDPLDITASGLALGHVVDGLRVIGTSGASGSIILGVDLTDGDGFLWDITQSGSIAGGTNGGFLTRCSSRRFSQFRQW